MSDDWNDEAQAAARARYEEEFDTLIRNAHTVEHRVFSIEQDLENLWLMMADDKTPDDFGTEIHDPFDYDRCDVDLLQAEYEAQADQGANFGKWPAMELLIKLSYGYAYLAALASASGTEPLAWNYVAYATYWQGLLHGLEHANQQPEGASARSENARIAAHVRNRENRAIKATAFDWLNDNFDGCDSRDDAAEKLTKIVPVAFRTARRYVNQWEMSIPSAR